MTLYSAYGLTIQSDVPLFELAAGHGSPDVRIRTGSLLGQATEVTRYGLHYRLDGQSVYLRREGIGGGSIREGREIVFDPEPDLDDRIARLFLLGPVLGVLLYQRGWPVVHASAVSMDGRAFGFVGFSESGKSTTAAAFVADGASLLADDLLAVRFDDDGTFVCPGFPQLKLWPDAATAAFGDEPANLPLIHPDSEKRGRRLPEKFHRGEPLPLARLYVLEEGEQTRVETMSPQESVIDLVRHSYGALFLQRAEPSVNLAQCAELARRVPVRRLVRPLTLDSLPAVTRAVREDLGAA